MGINTTRYKVLAFVISSALAGMAGVLFGHYTSFLSTNDFQFIRSFEIIIMIVLGGMGSLTGSCSAQSLLRSCRSCFDNCREIFHVIGWSFTQRC